MRRIATNCRIIFPVIALIALFLTSNLAYSQQAQRTKTVIVRVRDASRVQALANRQGLRVKKVISRGTGTLLVVNADDVNALRRSMRNEGDVLYVENNTIIPLGGGETVLPLGGGETVLPLGGGETVLPLGLTDPDNETISTLLGGGETVLPLGGGETVLPLEAIRAAYARMSTMVTPSGILLLQPAFLKVGLYHAVLQSTGRGVVVADLDTGIDTCHEVLKGVLQISFVDETTIPENCPTPTTPHVPGFGHGTAVASLIRMMAPEATVWALRVFDSTGTAEVSDIYESIIYATDHGADVINMSFGTTEFSQTLADAVDYAASRGVILVAAAGNSGQDALMYPAAFPRVRAVVATMDTDVKPEFSNYNVKANFSAPGAKVWVAYPNHRVAQANGTSYAAPFVAAEAALSQESFENNETGVTAATIMHAMRRAVENIDTLNPGFASKLGLGRIYMPWSLWQE